MSKESCPVFMADGRLFTNYLPRRAYHARVVNALQAKDTHDVREKLVKLGRDPILNTPITCQMPMNASNFLAMNLTNVYNGEREQGNAYGKRKEYASAL